MLTISYYPYDCEKPGRQESPRRSKISNKRVSIAYIQSCVKELLKERKGSNMGEAKQDDDAMLIEFLSSLLDYTPTIPDELAEHYLTRSGFQCPDVRITRLVSIATQKFIAEIASDAFQLCKARQAGVSKEKRDKQQKDKRLVLTIEDLSMALREYGVNMKRQEYFAESTSSGTTPASKEE